MRVPCMRACMRTSDAGDDADNREAQRGVAEQAEVALQLLLVAQLPDARLARVQRGLAHLH